MRSTISRRSEADLAAGALALRARLSAGGAELCVGSTSIACQESQAPYHVASEGLNFTVKAYLRTKGATMAELDRVIGRSLTEALIRGEAQGLPRIPAQWRMAVAEVAECCREDQFVYLTSRGTIVRRRGAAGRLRGLDPRPHRARCRGALRPASRRAAPARPPRISSAACAPIFERLSDVAARA